MVSSGSGPWPYTRLPSGLIDLFLEMLGRSYPQAGTPRELLDVLDLAHPLHEPAIRRAADR